MLKEAGAELGDRRPLGAAAAVRRDRRDRQPQGARRSSQAGLYPIVCIGETLDEREGGQTLEVLDRQVKVGLDGLSAEQVADLVIAYEPVWAIGTGRNATPEQAGEAHAHIRGRLRAVVRRGRRRAVPHDLRRQREAGQRRGALGAARHRRRAGRRRQPRRPRRSCRSSPTSRRRGRRRNRGVPARGCRRRLSGRFKDPVYWVVMLLLLLSRPSTSSSACSCCSSSCSSRARGGDIASAFGGGGSSQTAFGARQGATVLSKATTILGALFMLGALFLNVLGQRPSSLLSGTSAPARPAPAPPRPRRRPRVRRPRRLHRRRRTRRRRRHRPGRHRLGRRLRPRRRRAARNHPPHRPARPRFRRRLPSKRRSRRRPRSHSRHEVFAPAESRRRVLELSFCPRVRRCAEPASIPPERKWRNWQTHQLEGLAPARAWGFESPLSHQLHFVSLALKAGLSHRPSALRASAFMVESPLSHQRLSLVQSVARLGCGVTWLLPHQPRIPVRLAGNDVASSSRAAPCKHLF